MSQMYSQSPLVRKLIELALQEDLALGDITTEVTVDKSRPASATIISKEPLVVCGTDLPTLIATVAAADLSANILCADGTYVAPGEVIVQLKGGAGVLLALERTILNFMQRMSGIATYTKQFVDQAGGRINVLDTRKTLPGWRVLDKYSVTVGGGKNHRFSLGDMILVKNNHIDAHPDGIHGALADIKRRKPPYMAWEVEVRNLEELSVALSHTPSIIMLDNFSDSMVDQALEIIAASPFRPMLEVSGGITSERARLLASKGIDGVSAGALTSAAKNVDISMSISIAGGK